MNETKSIMSRWLYPMEPVYEHPFMRISRIIEVDGRGVVPSGEALLFLSQAGTLDDAITISDGTWGSPVRISDERIAIACQERSVALVEPAGRGVSTGALPASAITPLLPGPDATLLLGVGSYECAVLCLDAHLHTRWIRVVAGNEGLRHSFALAEDGTLWVPSDNGLLRLRADSGAIMARSDPDTLFACVSNPVVSGASALVAGTFRDGRCALLRVSPDGAVTVMQALPCLMRAYVSLDRAGGLWLAGSSGDWQQPRPDEDHVWIARLAADGAPGRDHRCVSQTAVELVLDRCGQAWVGTYTYDERGERGELYGLSADGEMQWSWRMEDPPSGVGTPLFFDSGQGMVATSNGVVGFELVGC